MGRIAIQSTSCVMSKSRPPWIARHGRGETDVPRAQVQDRGVAIAPAGLVSFTSFPAAPHVCRRALPPSPPRAARLTGPPRRKQQLQDSMLTGGTRLQGAADLNHMWGVLVRSTPKVGVREAQIPAGHRWTKDRRLAGVRAAIFRREGGGASGRSDMRTERSSWRPRGGRRK